MKLRVNKAALSLSTAFLMVSSVVSVATSAAGTNEIKLSADKAFAQAGDKIELTVSYSPDDVGVAGMTLILHYDPKKTAVYVPTDDEMDTDFDLGGEFSVITNYAASESTVKIVGAKLGGGNVTEETPVARAEFTVLDGAQGDIDFWVEAETMVAETDDGYDSAAYSAPSKSSPFAIEAPSQTTTVTAASTEAVTTTKATTTTIAATEKSTTTSKTTSAETTTTTSITTTTQPVTSETTAETTAQTTSSYTEPLFSYVQGENDFESEEALQFSARLSDYITDYTQNYDIRFNFNTTGNVSGAVGTLVNGEWDSSYYESFGVNSDHWTLYNVDPNTTADLIYMQVYYLKANAQLDITSVEVVSSDTFDTPAEISTTAVTTESAAQPAESYEPTQTTTTAPAETVTSYEQTTSESENTIASEPAVTETAAAPQETSSDSQTVTEPEKSETESGTVTSAPEMSESSADSSSSVQTEQTKAQEIIDAVDSAAEKASSPSSENPNTGSSAGKTVMNILTIAAIAEIAFSLFAMIFNKVNKKD